MCAMIFTQMVNMYVKGFIYEQSVAYNRSGTSLQKFPTPTLSVLCSVSTYQIWNKCINKHIIEDSTENILFTGY